MFYRRFDRVYSVWKVTRSLCPANSSVLSGVIRAFELVLDEQCLSFCVIYDTNWGRRRIS
ncbi:hypothetical protein CCR75_002441 [Bremia lactucae]|uniref:Uncharacterized protein n=1 Tax=Bremia lactucae TaxID=4779 RepID=A0A976IIF8_BRELC|nr:hypothetical protein CCR75_002441 [Bremia lactucae]